MANRVRLAAGLDAGSSRTRCVICAVEESRIRFLGAGEVESRGWVIGRIADADAMSECVRQAAREAEQNAQMAVEGVVAGLGDSAYSEIQTATKAAIVHVWLSGKKAGVDFRYAGGADDTITDANVQKVVDTAKLFVGKAG